MRKNFVLDTNVFLHDPLALASFEDNNIIIPIYVIEEIDSFKKELSELGRNAREVSRKLDQLRRNGRLIDGVPLNGPESGTLRVAFTERELPSKFALTSEKADSRILATALDVLEKEPDTPLIFISKDINLRIRAAALGLQVQDYNKESADISELYCGIYEITVSTDQLQDLYSNGRAPISERVSERVEVIHPNSFGIITDSAGKGSALVRLRPVQGEMVLLKGSGNPVWGIRPRNKEQRFAFELLLDDSVKLVSLVGMAGTGKTLLALAAGMQRVVEDQHYQRLLVSRPVFPMGRDIGFLPGDVEDKLRPWMQPVHDNLELLLGISHKDKKAGRTTDELFDLDMVHIEPLTYIRGRSINNQFILVDEAQNLTPHEVKTIITRVGEGTKIVFTGDPYQVDNPYVDSTNNGLVHIVKRFTGESIAGHVTLTKGERSELAERAARLL